LKKNLLKLPYKVLAVLTLSSLSVFGETLTEEASSVPFSWNFTDHALLTSAKDPGDSEVPAVNLISHQSTLGGEIGPIRGSVTFSNQFTPNGEPSLNQNFILDKKTLTGEWENWEVRLGDSHQEFGRGIALSLFSNPIFGVDNTLEGGSLKYRYSSLEILGFGGRVNALRAPVAINPVDTLMTGREVVLAGGAVTAAVMDQTRLSAHYHATSSRPEGKEINKRYQTVGVSLDSKDFIPGVDAYIESNVMDWEAFSYGKGMKAKPRAYASFASLTYSDLSFRTKLEVKDYRNFLYEFQRPPTLEEEIVLATNNSDVSAARLVLENRFGENRSSSLGASYLMGQDRELKVPIYHPIVFSKYKLSRGLEMELRGGYRWMPTKNNLAHGSFKTKVKTSKGQYFELELRRQNLNQAINTPIPIREERNIALATYTFSEKFNIGFGYEYMPTNLPEVGNHFMNGSATYQTGILTARGFFGKTSGGTQCSSGVCRQVPAYTGAYLETSVTF